MMGELARKQTATIQFPDQRRGWSSGILTPDLAERVMSVCDGMPKLRRALNDWIQRDIDTTAIANSGTDSEWVSDMFINTLEQSARAIALGDTVGSDGGQADLARLTPDEGQLRGATEGAALVETDSLTFGGRKLNTVELYWYERVTLNFLEQNIQGRTAEAAIGPAVMQGFAEQLNRLAIEGNVAGADPFYGIIDGWMKDAIDEGATSLASTDLAFTNVTTMGEFLDKLWSKFNTPGQYMEDLVWLLNADSMKRLEIESRTGTGESDVATSIAGPGLINRGFMNEQVFGQSRKSPTADELWRVLLTSRRNIVTSVGRDMRVDVKFEPRARAFDYIVTSRVAFGVRDPAACILGVPPAALQDSGVPADGP